MILVFAIIGAIVAFVPGASFFLIALEIYLVYHFAHKHPSFSLIPFLGISAGLVSISLVLKGLATFLHVMPLVGQVSNSIVAFAFIMFIGNAAEKHYSK